MLDDASMRRNCKLFDLLSYLLLAAICAAFYIALPKAGDIWWMDAPRHALNGAFVLDFLRAMPLHAPQEFAFDYYRQWPALTILFYPPLFYGFLAVGYALFGVSEASALLVELAFLYALGVGSYRLAREWLTPMSALCCAVIVIGSPGAFYWGQQIMLDIPAWAFLTWSVIAFVSYRRDGKTWQIVACAALLVLAIYTKYNAVFIGLAYGVILLADRRIWPGNKTFKAILLAAAVAAVMMTPLLVIFFKFSAYNLSQAVTVENSNTGRWTWESLGFYASILPDLITWPVTLFALASPIALFLRRKSVASLDLLLIWLGVGYAFYSMIAVKEPRHFLFVVTPVVVLALLAIRALPLPQLARNLIGLALAAVVLAFSWQTAQPTYVTGMRQAATDVAKLAPHDSNVGFWGRLDGTFIFAMRAYADRPDLGVVRLDKLLFSDVAVSMERGYTDNQLTPEKLIEQVRALHMQYVVAQTVYENDSASVRALHTALESDKFEEVGRIPMTSNGRFSYLDELVIYRFREALPPGRVAPAMQIKLIGKSI